MAVLIDASVLIEYEQGRIDLSTKLAGRETEEFFLSVVTASKLLHGVHRATKASVRARRAAFVEAILERFPLLGIDLATARAHARLWAELASAGTLIGPHDLWLAAGCLAHGLAIATANTREFTRVPGLSIEDWSQDG
ncbi:MAG: type II toxin-antitoxin system VapC family toxin [Gemmatimonadetes bacterium]|nr:type II toxin-antitoxin system VapC family toxin [Gemmatimonadota bacterium]